MKVNWSGRTLGGLLLAVAIIAPIGCGSSGKAVGTVSGKVTYNGSPVSGGDVNLYSKSGSAAMAPLGEGGTFKIEGA